MLSFESRRGRRQHWVIDRIATALVVNINIGTILLVTGIVYVVFVVIILIGFALRRELKQTTVRRITINGTLKA